MTRAVAAIGYTSEKTFGYFVKAMEENGVDMQVLDLARLRQCGQASYHASRDNLRVVIDDDVYDLGDFGAIYQRSYYTDLGREGMTAWASELLCEINAYLSTCPGLVVNRPHAPEINGSKFAHQEVLRGCGLAVPKSFVLSDAETARKLLRPDHQWISKGCSGQRTEVAVVDVQSYMRLDALARAPALFQERIRGANIRTHRVGDRSVSLKIESDGIDYRYAETTEFELIDTPGPIEVAISQYQKETGLAFIGFDFRIDEQTGQWICLEANPMPGYDFYDRQCEGAVSKLLGQLLATQRAPAYSPIGENGREDSDMLFIELNRRRAVNMP